MVGRKSPVMPRFCFGCHSNRRIARALARALENLELTQCKFASYRRRKPQTSRVTIKTSGFNIKPSSYTSRGLCYPLLV